MMKVFISYRLAEGVSFEDYEKWSIEHDQPTASSLPGVNRYEIYKIEGSADGEPYCDIFEDIEVDDWSSWVNVSKYPIMQNVLAGFEKLGDLSDVKVIYGSPIKRTADPQSVLF